MGLRFDMTELNPGKWFFFDPTDETAGVCLRVAPSAVFRKISAKAEKKGKTDQEIFDKELWDYCITGWKGIEDADGQEIECTTENKVRLMGGAPDFAIFVSEKLAEIRENKLNDRDLEKN